MPNKIFLPPLDPRKWANKAANYIDDPMRAEDRGIVRPLIAGGIQGIGDYISNMADPEAMVGIGVAPNVMQGAGALGRIGNAVAEKEMIPAVRDEAGRLLVPERRMQVRPPGPWDMNPSAPRQESINPEDIMMQKIRERFNMGHVIENDPTIGRRR